MSRPKSCLKIIPILIVFVVLAFHPVWTMGAEKIEWKMATTSPPGHYMAKRYVVPFIDKIREDSGGRLDIKLFYLGQLPYDGTHYLPVLKERGLDAALTGIKDIVGDISVTGVFNLPFFFPDVENVQAAARGLRPIFDREFGKYNARPIYYAEAQTIQIMNRKSQLQSLEAFKGLKLRVLGPEPAEALKALGASPVTVSLGELYTSLQRGILDGAMTNEGSALGTKLQEVCKYFILVNFQEFMTMSFVNVDSFNALPKDIQKIVLDAAAWMEKVNFAEIHKETDQDRATLKQKGVEIIRMPPAELDKVRKKVAHITENWVAKSPVHKEAYGKSLEAMKGPR